MKRAFITVTLIFLLSYVLTTFSQPLPPFYGKISTIPPNVQKLMRQYTWRPTCPIPLTKLRYLEISYYGFDHKVHKGSIIVNEELAKQVLTIFKLLYQHKFPIQSIIPMYKFKGSDEASMEANNTSSFNCRQVSEQPGIYSQHSYGRAIDINTRINPYIKKLITLPENGKVYSNRCQPAPGKIVQDGIAYKIFTSRHWAWGGAWYDLHDYQHFEKRKNGELRNPFGYV